MDGKVILVIGQRGCGKTTKVKELIKNVHPDALLLHDVGGQYKDIYKKPLLKFEEFTKLCTKVEKGVMVFEEATIFLNPTRNQDIVDFLVTSRYRENTVIFVFHSLRFVPRSIYDLTNNIILFKTKDTLKVLEDRFDDPELIEIFKRLQTSPDKHVNVNYEL